MTRQQNAGRWHRRCSSSPGRRLVRRTLICFRANWLTLRGKFWSGKLTMRNIESGETVITFTSLSATMRCNRIDEKWAGRRENFFWNLIWREKRKKSGRWRGRRRRVWLTFLVLRELWIENPTKTTVVINEEKFIKKSACERANTPRTTCALCGNDSFVRSPFSKKNFPRALRWQLIPSIRAYLTEKCSTKHNKAVGAGKEKFSLPSLWKDSRESRAEHYKIIKETFFRSRWNGKFNCGECSMKKFFRLARSNFESSRNELRHPQWTWRLSSLLVAARKLVEVVFAISKSAVNRLSLWLRHFRRTRRRHLDYFRPLLNAVVAEIRGSRV